MSKPKANPKSGSALERLTKSKSTATTKAKISSESGGVVSAEDFFKEEDFHGDRIVEVEGNKLKFTNLHKVYWPKEGYTKGDLLKYYWFVSKYMLPYLKDRPEIMRRFPNGINGPFFYQHDLDDPPKFVRSHSIRSSDGSNVRYALVDNVSSLLYIANLGAIAQNPFHSRIGSLDKPDYFVLDLDPESGASFKTVCTVALEVNKVLKELGLVGYPKTSGSTGLHLYVPIVSRYSYDQIVNVGRYIASTVAERNPDISTVERMTKNRKKGQVYVDFLQNIEGKTIAAVYSAREKPGATVSAPVTWLEVKKGISLLDFTIKTMPERLKKKGDLFTPVIAGKQKLDAILKQLR
jgi:bifunctional non-homologous end joining protein LigD